MYRGPQIIKGSEKSDLFDSADIISIDSENIKDYTLKRLLERFHVEGGGYDYLSSSKFDRV